MMYEQICTYIPHVIQSLYTPAILKSTTLEEIRDALRPDQIACKAWLLEQLKDRDNSSKVLVIGSWIGFTSYCLYKIGFARITEVDIEQRLEPMAKLINRDNQYFTHIVGDVNNIDISNYDIIINTSCEHISSDAWFDTISPGCWVALQSTNFVSDDHVNTVNSLEEMKIKYSVDLSYAGEKQLSPIFTRYMVCGTKL